MILFQVVLAGAFYPNYFTFGQPDEEMAVRELAGKDPKTTIAVGAPFQSGCYRTLCFSRCCHCYKYLVDFCLSRGYQQLV